MAVYDGKGAAIGFIGLTDRRLILQDNSLAGKRVAITSIPYGTVNAIGRRKTYEMEFLSERRPSTPMMWFLIYMLHATLR